MFQATPPVSLEVLINPNTEKVPYSATIVCTAPPGEFTFELPNETVGPQTTHTLEVVVDSLNWEAVVSWTNGVNVRTCTVNATGNNPRPNIHGIRINGKNDLWLLKPMERTLIEVIVYYENEWRVSSFGVEGSNSSVPFTVFRPTKREFAMLIGIAGSLRTPVSSIRSTLVLKQAGCRIRQQG
ncbi:hypothetical protein ACFLS0_00295 [Candidatus Bipolaricaulota bacterium]